MGIQIAFIDIETVPQNQTINDSITNDLFNKKFKRDILELPIKPSIGYNAEAMESLWNEKASLHAEFGKIVCISIGLFKDDKLRVTSIASRNEKTILEKSS